MNTSIRISPVVALLALTIASCGSMRTASDVRDDVYYMPSDAPLTASISDVPPASEPATQTQEKSAPPSDDYYDAETATQYAPSNYYDMAYNDPYYYNYGRFGFNSGLTGLAGRTGFGYGQNGMMIGFGYGTGMYSGWSAIPNYGYGGYYSGWNPYGPYGNAFYDPWYNGFGGYGGYGGYGGFGGYYGNPYGGFNGGWGPYYGPYGNACPYYSPVIVGGSSSSVVSHRPGMGGNSSTGLGGASSRPANEFRDPIGLTNRATDQRSLQPIQGQQTRTPDQTRIRYYEPERQPTTRPSRETSPRTSPARGNNGTERAAPSRNDGGSRNNNNSGGGSGSGGDSGGRRR